MSTNHPVPQSDASAFAGMANDHFAAVDMGTNSFKVLIVQADTSTGRFLPIHRHKEPVLLGLDTTTTSAAVITPPSMDRAIAALIKFQEILLSYRIPSSKCRFVATSAVREASNQSEFLSKLRQNLNLHVDVLSGQDEARLIYLGVVQFLPVISDTVLTVDIGGGSTEIVIGKKGNILHAVSLKLGHVTLTQQFFKITRMREHIRNVLKISGLVDRVRDYRIERVTGSSGTIKAIENAVYQNYAKKNVGEIKGNTTNRDWRFNKEELMELVESLEMKGKEKREEFFKKRAEFILAGAILLEEVFEGLGIEEMEVSEYALAEGLMADMLGKVDERLNVDARWESVVRLAARLNSKKRMKSAALCAGLAREIFKGIRKQHAIDSELVEYLEDKDIEYLEVACLLHNIGLYAGKKGYHKQSYLLIINGNHLQGYSDHEIKLIGLLVKHHRKKFPKADNASLEEFTDKVKHKFIMLCAILRLSAVIEQLPSVDSPRYEFSHSPEGLRLVLGEARNQPLSVGILQPLAGVVKEELDKEVENFRRVFEQKLALMVY